MEAHIRIYEERVLDQARMGGHHLRDGRELTELELLALLQHNGAATRLIDFTRNAFLALWFCLEDESQKDNHGVVIGTDLNAVDHHWLSYAESRPSIEDILVKNPNSLLIYQPDALFERMRAQQGFFMFGTAIANNIGTLPALGRDLPVDHALGIPNLSSIAGNGQSDLRSLEQSTRDDFKRIAVSPQLKSWMQLHGTQLLGFHPNSIYPDLPGFCRAHGSMRHFDWENWKWRS